MAVGLSSPISHTALFIDAGVSLVASLLLLFVAVSCLVWSFRRMNSKHHVVTQGHKYVMFFCCNAPAFVVIKSVFRVFRESSVVCFYISEFSSDFVSCHACVVCSLLSYMLLSSTQIGQQQQQYRTLPLKWHLVCDVCLYGEKLESLIVSVSRIYTCVCATLYYDASRILCLVNCLMPAAPVLALCSLATPYVHVLT